jgi:regulator of sirC expression with transglutaminase-like and TPR domain
MKLSEFKALVSLLDDEDVEVSAHVTEKLISLGRDGLPLLESAWEVEKSKIIQEKIEDLINKIEFENIKDRFRYWLENGKHDLMEGALIINQIQYPEIDELAIQQKINSLAKAAWIELNSALSPLEELQVLNQIFFQLHGFFGNPNNVAPNADLGCLSKVLETKKGNSLSLGILFLMIAQKNDLPIYGVNLPFHFILCYSKKSLSKEILSENADDTQVMFYINPLNKGVAFSRMEITHYLQQMKISAKKKYYAPCSNKEIIKSLIYNQISCYPAKDGKAILLKELFEMF